MVGQKRKPSPHTSGNVSATLATIQAEALLTPVKKRLCFVAIPFSPTESVSGKDDWGKIFNRLIRPAVESYSPPLGSFTFVCERQETRQGRWVEEITDNLLTADLVIVDLTDLNPNVCTELGVRLASGLPLIRISIKNPERLGNLAGHGVMIYRPEDSIDVFSRQLHANMDEVLSSTRPATWLSPERQLLAKRVQGFHLRAKEKFLEVSEVIATITNRVEEGYFFYDFWRFCRYWGKRVSGGVLTISVEPSMFRSRSSENAGYSTWPVVVGPLHHVAWPLFLRKDIERAGVWIQDIGVEVFIGPSLGKTPLPLDLKVEKFIEVLGDGTNVVIPRIVGTATLPASQRELSLWIRFTGMFHPRILPRIFFFPEGFVTGRWKVSVDASESEFGCSVMPLTDRAEVDIMRLPYPTTEREGSIEISPHRGSLLLPTDGALVSLFPAGSL